IPLLKKRVKSKKNPGTKHRRNLGPYKMTKSKNNRRKRNPGQSFRKYFHNSWEFLTNKKKMIEK
ncbi:hypothetical protein, partial [Streptococcus merionis]|uniref:hypothetical protein n=1 Tax=Streptococcus merionis TaxID=400065 RepID=UPI0026F00702